MAVEMFPELQALADQLTHRSPVELPTSTSRTFYGYVRTDKRNLAYANACADLLTWWSTTEGWRPGTVFRDLGVSSETLNRSGFTGLLDVLWLPDSDGVVVVENAHLSDSALVVKRLTLAVHRTGATVRSLADELAEVTA
jgi:hypothetical protein